MAGGYSGPTNFPDWTPLDHSLQRRWEDNGSTLQFGFSNNTGKVSLIAWHNDASPKVDGKSQRSKIDMTPMQAKLILNALRMMADGKLENDTFNIGFKTQYMGQQKLDTPRVIGRVLVRKSADKGVIGLTIIDGSKPPLTFKMLPPSNAVEVIGNDKQPVNMTDLSKVETLAWVSTIEPIIDHLVSFKTEEKKKNGEKSNRGGRQNSDHVDFNTSSDDDDIPF